MGFCWVCRWIGGGGGGASSSSKGNIPASPELDERELQLELSSVAPSSSASAYHHQNQVFQLQDLTGTTASTTAAIVKVYPQLHHYPEMLDSLKTVGGDPDESDFSGAPLLNCATKASCCQPGEIGGADGVGELCLLTNCTVAGCVNNTSEIVIGPGGHHGYRMVCKNGENHPPSDESSPLTPRKHPYSIVPMKALHVHEIEVTNKLAKREGK